MKSLLLSMILASSAAHASLPAEEVERQGFLLLEANGVPSYLNPVFCVSSAREKIEFIFSDDFRYKTVAYVVQPGNRLKEVSRSSLKMKFFRHLDSPRGYTHSVHEVQKDGELFVCVENIINLEGVPGSR